MSMVIVLRAPQSAHEQTLTMANHSRGALAYAADREHPVYSLKVQ